MECQQVPVPTNRKRHPHPSDWISYYFIGDSYSQESDVVYNEAEVKQNSTDNTNIQAEHDEEVNKAKELLAHAIDNWVSYAKLRPESSWMVIHLLRDALFALNRYNEIESILKEVLDSDSDNVDIIAALADYYDHMGDSNSALKIIDEGEAFQVIVDKLKELKVIWKH